MMFRIEMVIYVAFFKKSKVPRQVLLKGFHLNSSLFESVFFSLTTYLVFNTFLMIIKKV